VHAAVTVARRRDIDISALAADAIGNLHDEQPNRAAQTLVRPSIAVYANRRLRQVVIEHLIGKVGTESGIGREATIYITLCWHTTRRCRSEGRDYSSFNGSNLSPSRTPLREQFDSAAAR
jgi:hypothetical protein